jgi:hypothetical protein
MVDYTQTLSTMSGLTLYAQVTGRMATPASGTELRKGNMSHRSNKQIALLGWREWVSLPALGIRHIKAKVDTGARTSALHAFSSEIYYERGVKMVRFRLHPWQKRTDIEQSCFAEVIDERVVSDSGGHRERRLVITTEVCIDKRCWPIEMTLTKRDNMQFRMLLGRTAIRGHFGVDPSASYLVGEKPPYDIEPS